MARSLNAAAAAAAVVITALGAWVLWQATALREGPGYAAVGPRVFPIIVGVGILAAGLALLWSSLRGGGAEAAEAAPVTDWPTLLGMAAALAAFIFVFQLIGFVVSASLFMVAGAWILGSRSPIRDLIAGLLVSGVTYFAFTRLLGLELPGGPLG
jgi:putative tricarboxylic transport membrane protein